MLFGGAAFGQVELVAVPVELAVAGLGEGRGGVENNWLGENPGLGAADLHGVGPGPLGGIKRHPNQEYGINFGCCETGRRGSQRVGAEAQADGVGVGVVALAGRGAAAGRQQGRSQQERKPGSKSAQHRP